MKNIKEIFDTECAHLEIDLRLLTQINRYAVGFVNRNPDHVAFFGGNLLGVNPVRFRNADLNEWYDGVLNIDDLKIRSEVLKLPTVRPDWVRGTDVMNLSCVWLCHKIVNQDKFSPAQKHQGMIDVLMILHYKFLTSLMAHYFKYPADESVALATYNALSKKFALKVYGSWNAMLRAKCEDIISKTSIHYKTIQRFDLDSGIVYFISDTQLRTRNIVKKMRAVFETIRTQDAKIHSTKMVGYNADGDQIVKDLNRNYSPYKRYLHDTVTDPGLWIRDDLVNVISSAMYTMPSNMLVDVLTYTSKHYGRGSIDIAGLLDEIILHAVEYLMEEQPSFGKTRDLLTLVTRLRANYMSSRSSDPSLMKIRLQSEELVKQSVKSKNPSIIAAVRTGFALYVVLYTFSMKTYQ